MFLNQTDVGTVVTGLAFRTKAERENDASKLMEVSCTVPLSAEMAEGALKHSNARAELFVQKAGEPGTWIPKADIKEVTFAAPAKARFLVRLAMAPGLSKPRTTLADVAIKQIWASKTEGNEWNLSFGLVSPLVAAKDAVPLIDSIKETVYLTFEEQNPGLEYETAVPGQDAAAVATVDESGTVEKVEKPKGRRGRAAAAEAPEEAETPAPPPAKKGPRLVKEKPGGETIQ